MHTKLINDFFCPFSRILFVLNKPRFIYQLRSNKSLLLKLFQALASVSENFFTRRHQPHIITTYKDPQINLIAGLSMDRQTVGTFARTTQATRML